MKHTRRVYTSMQQLTDFLEPMKVQKANYLTFFVNVLSNFLLYPYIFSAASLLKHVYNLWNLIGKHNLKK
jgi:hypothetical protein